MAIYEFRAQEILGIFDESLRFVQELRPSSLLVFKVKKDESYFVFKIGSSELSFDLEHITQEALALKRLQGVPGVPGFQQSYGARGEYCGALLKEFFQGQTLAQLRKGLNEIGLQRKVEEAVRAIHNKGFANLDLSISNVALSPDKKDFCLIDLGTVIHRDNVHNHTFEDLKSTDLRELQDLGY